MKFHDDSCFSNEYNASVAGIGKEELLYLELKFLKLIDFHLQVSPKTFEEYYIHLVEVSDKQAVLWNCSCLEPAHCIKTKKRVSKRVSHPSSHNYRENSSKNVHLEVQKPKNKGKLKLESKSTSAHSGAEAGNDNHYEKDDNRIMEDELKQASELLDSGRIPSFRADKISPRSCHGHQGDRGTQNSHKTPNSTNSNKYVEFYDYDCSPFCPWRLVYLSPLNRKKSASQELRELMTLRKSTYANCKYEQSVKPPSYQIENDKVYF